MGSVDSTEVEDSMDQHLVAAFGSEDEDSTSRFRRQALERRAEMEDDWQIDPEEDEYDPRKPEYIRPATAEEVEEQNQKLLYLQVRQLEKAISERTQEVADPVVAHYRAVLFDLCKPMKAPMDGIPGVAQGLGQLSSCRNQRGRNRSLLCSGKLAMGKRRQRSTRRAVLPSVEVEDADTSPSPQPSPKRSAELDFWDGAERPKKRLPCLSLNGHSFLEVAPEVELPGQFSHPTYAAKFANVANIRSGFGVEARPVNVPLNLDCPFLLAAA